MSSTRPAGSDQRPSETRARTISETLAAFAAGLEFGDIPAEVVERAKLHILDALGVGLAASRCDFADAALRGVQDLGGEGDAPVIGRRARLPLRDAALMNGTLIHGLDFDDTHISGVVHGSASAVPVMLAQGARASGREALAAYLIAIETGARIGMAAKGGFHRLGYHPTGIVGAFACALAAGRLKRLSQERLVHAQGIVLSQASGTFEFLEEGAWTKRMHPGWAALSGITAAALAGAGFVGPTKPYEGRFGLYKTHLGKDAEIDWQALTSGLGDEWEMLRVALKPYPLCHFNHAFADATLALMRKEGLKASEVETITALIGEGEVETVCEPEANKRRPANDYDARFSLHYTIAATLARGRFTLAELSGECLEDPDILALCDKVEYRVDPKSAFPEAYSGEVIVTTTDGRSLRHREDVNRGAGDRPLSEREAIAKFQENANGVLGTEGARRLQDAVMALDERGADLGTLLGALSPENAEMRETAEGGS